MSSETQEWVVPVLTSLMLAAFVVMIAVGVRLLLFPFRLAWRQRRPLADRLGRLGLTLAVLWTMAVAPAPFLYLWSWLIRLAQALLVDMPGQFWVTLPSLVDECRQASGCVSTAAGVATVLWSNAIGQPIRNFAVPPGIVPAVAAFGLAVGLLALARLALRRRAPAALLSGQMGAAIVLGASFLAAFYLSVASILAIPVFAEKVPDIGPLDASLAAQLGARTPAAAVFTSVDRLLADRAGLQLQLPASTSMPGLDVAWADQVAQWDRAATALKEDADGLPGAAHDFTETALSFFRVSDEGHVGEMVTQRHVTVLVNSYGLWLADYRAAIDRCAADLRDGLNRLQTLRGTLLEYDREQQTVTGAGSTGGLNKALQNSFVTPCGDPRPVVRDYLPERSGPAETLGAFGLATAWLLRTENQELALIVGLLGFGFLGALATSFIREFRSTPGNLLPSMDFVLPALIRGIGAAILVFLLAKGGVAIFIKGSDATPNPYAIFFACFVAAVFSDDVWVWARNRQNSGLGGRES